MCWRPLADINYFGEIIKIIAIHRSWNGQQCFLHIFGSNWPNVLESDNYRGPFFTMCSSTIMVYFFKSSVIKKINSRPFASIKVLIWRKFFFTVIFYINTPNSIQRMFFVPPLKKLLWMLILASSKWVAKKIIPGSR